MYRELINNATEHYPFITEHVNVRYIPHFHDETEVIYVTEGELTVTLADGVFALRKGEICIITPGIIHNLYTSDTSKSIVLKLYSSTEASSVRLENAIFAEGSPFYDELRFHVEAIMRENDAKEECYRLAVNLHSGAIMLLIMRKLPHSSLENGEKIKSENANSLLISVLEFLENHYGEDILLSDISKHLCYTKSYFCHQFKKITGVTFWRYYTIFRVEKAAILIKEHPRKKIIEIAGECGFKNVRSFNKAFKEYINCTPREYSGKYPTEKR